MTRITQMELEAQLRRLENLSRNELAQEWLTAYGTPAPRKSSRDFLLKAVSHQLQVKAFGDVRPATRKALLKIGRSTRSGATLVDLPAPATGIKPGTRLIRAWRGDTHEVIVVTDGRFEWNGARHRSLSAIATAITGTRRNGPAFFGLRETAATGEVQCAGPTAAGGQVAISDRQPQRRGPVRHLHPQVLRGGAGAGFQLAACPKGSLPGLHPQPAAGRLDGPGPGL